MGVGIWNLRFAQSFPYNVKYAQQATVSDTSLRYHQADTRDRSCGT
jgi:hypothetical protein